MRTGETRLRCLMYVDIKNMDEEARAFIAYITDRSTPQHNKAEVESTAAARFSLIKDRKVYYNKSFAVRFCYISRSSFSNTVLSLSALEKYDGIPFFVVVVSRDMDNKIFLANTTFLRKVSHSSKELSLTNIRGSFNGSDIIRKCAGLVNSPENFDELYTIHKSVGWQENFPRIVEATSAIKSVAKRYVPDTDDLNRIYSSVKRAETFVKSEDFRILKRDLDDRCSRCAAEIMIAAHIENVNIRGRLIERLIAAGDGERDAIIKAIRDVENRLPESHTNNTLGDYVRDFGNVVTYTDIKTKIVYLRSNPKAYNIDKFLEQMADDHSVMMFYFIGIGKDYITRTALCSVYHKELIQNGNTIIQQHWAGLSRRGTAQFKGCVVNHILENEAFENDIDETISKGFLTSII